MKSVLTVIALVIALGAAGAAGYGFLERTREAGVLNDTIEKLKTRLAAAEMEVDKLAVQNEHEPAGENKTLQEQEKDIVALREKVEDVTSQVENFESRITNLQMSDKQNKIQLGKLASKVENLPADGGITSAVRKEDIEELIEEKMKSQQRLGKEPPLSAVAARLGLEDVERKALEDILRLKKNDMMTLLKTPRTDSTNMLDEFGDALIEVFSSGGGEKEVQKKFVKFFGRLASEKVPGTDQTYLVKITELHQSTRQAFKQTLSEKQFSAFEELGIENATDIKIDNDPLGAYIMQRMQAAGVNPDGNNDGN